MTSYSIDAMRRRRFTCFSEIETDNGPEVGSALDSIPDTNLMPEELVERLDLQQSLLCAIQALPQKYRSIVLLYYTSRLSFSEIGRVLNRPYTTVRTQFRRAKSSLRTALATQS